ncbi:MAG: caspase domain-containing protein [Gammaproteobacteria bacterium]|nr:caspase domain-containing protein [Gammaproteobacteria bacterium]
MRCRLLGILVLTLALMPIPATAKDRYALVIGNGAYKDITPLKNPPNDAELIRNSLRQVGFDVQLLLDADKRRMDRAVNEFADKLDQAGEAAVGLFYFAGHGVAVNNLNYLIPVGAPIQTQEDVPYYAVPENWVLDKLERARNKTDIIILDACRDNPLPKKTRSAASGLSTPQTSSEGIYIAYSTSPGMVAYDGDGDYSPFAEALAAEIKTPHITIDFMMTSVRRQVNDATANRGPTKQRPWSLTSITDPFYFVPPTTGANTIAANNNSNRQPVQPVKKSQEEILWERVSAKNTIDDYDFYLKQYPKGQYANLAKYERKQLKDAQRGPDTGGDEDDGNVFEDLLGALAGNTAQPRSSGDLEAQNTGGSFPNQNTAGGFGGPATPGPGGGMPQQGQQAFWVDDEWIQWDVVTNGNSFSASTFYPDMGQITLQGQAQGAMVNYYIYDSAGQQIGYGQGSFMDATHLSVVSYWMNGVEIGRGQFHINHQPN